MLETWRQTLDVLKTRLDPVQFETWLSPLKQVEGTEGSLTLEVPDEFFARWVRDNYLDIIKDAVWDTTRCHVGIDFKISGSGGEKRARRGKSDRDGQAISRHEDLGERLVPRFTFDTFVVGPSNEVGHSACEMVAENPAGSYNPMFIYGGVGLGKTHLIQAVGHEIRRRFPDMRILYMSGESYVNEIMTAVKNNRLDAVRYRYRGQCDVLLVDDIQYLANREFAQEEFYHTFNELYNAQKQIVITGDQFPSAIPKVSERLRSRFGWGLIVDIGPPELELRVRIVQQKAAREGVKLSDDVASYLASRFTTSVRDLEGALNRVTAHALIRKIPLTLDLARRVTDRIVTDRRGRLTTDVVLKIVAEYFQLQVSDLKSARRHRGVSMPRQIAIHILRKHTGASLQSIGQALGGRSHTTVLSALSRIEKVIESEPATERALKDIERQLGMS
ncbi:MAG: chromosomal replication initiator protein DnaA [Deltaproteobacteria bacterium]|nr:chromosomal replication initiator protein DnaA [Deltaproteobacteria bacterium]